MLDDSSGKSGAKFYQSYDKLFIIKTLTSEEVERMHSFLKHYHPVSTIESECHEYSRLHGHCVAVYRRATWKDLVTAISGNVSANR